MKNFFITGILCIVGLALSLKVFSQINGTVGWQDIQDTSWIDFGDKMLDYAPNGGAFTPKGTMKVLVIYAGLYEPGVFEETAIDASLDNWPTIDINGNHNTIPATPEALLFSSASQLSDPQYANLRNLTRYYYEMSKGAFTLLGDVVRDPIPSSPTYGQPVRINVDPTGATSWSQLNQRVLQKLYTLYGSEWATMWLPFDTRTNNPNFDYDNSTSVHDNKIDLIIIQWRYSTGWNPQPIPGMQNMYLSGNAVASTYLGISNGYNFSTGFSIFSGNITGEACVGFFPHEIAHILYNCPHLMGANSTLGNYFYKPDAGWGMMSSNNRAMMCANSWERWLLGWTDLISNGENTDLQSASDLNSNGIYTVRDFLTTGDMIRVKVPQTTNTYLWIENHVKTNLFDYKLWAGGAPSPQGETIPPTDAGVYMFLENVAPTRNNFTLSALDMNRVNAIKPLNAQGNYDYIRFFLPLESPAGTIDPNYYWNNEVYTFQKTNENPISGTNAWYVYIDDYRTYITPSGSSTHIYSAPPNGTINIQSDFNGCPNCETKPIIRETDGTNTNMLYENTFGRNNEAINIFGRRSDAFQATDEISKSGIVPVLNIPTFTSGSVNEYILNGLRVDVLTKDPVTGTVTIKVQFEDYNLRSNKRWTGKIGLNDLTNNNNPDLIIDPSVELLIDKTGTNNRKTLIGSHFIDPTIFNCYNGAYVLQDVNSTVIVDNGSGLLLNSTSNYTVSNGAILIIRNGSTLLLKSGSNLIVYGTGKVIVEQGAYICIESGANITLTDITSTLDLQAGFIFGTNPELNLASSCVDFCSLTLNGTGSVLSSDTHITGALNWSENNYIINSNLIIGATAILNISIATLKFTDNGKLTVNTGGKLVFDNSILTDACGTLWQGIEVQGNKNLAQYPETNQGVVEIINGGIIENAITAIRTYGPNQNYTGGIVKANGAIFRNNVSGIYIAPYHNHLPNGALTGNRSYIKNCTFETSSVLNNPTLNPTSFIRLVDVEGIIIKGNTFTNTNPAPTTLIEKGNGISVFNASCTIEGICTSGTIPCSSYQPNTFQGLNYAIQVNNSNSLKTVSISNNTFSNNYRGILLRYANNSVITSNHFDVPDILTNNPLGSYGLYVESCNGYKIEGNIFESVLNQQGTYGVAFKTLTGIGANNLYRNQFKNLSIGVISANTFPPPFQLKATTQPPPQLSINGLQIKCNRFIDTYNKDIAITSGQIGNPHGSCSLVTSPANNMFSFTGTNPDKDIFVNPGAGLFGYCHSTDVQTTPVDYTNNKVSLLPCSAFPVFSEAISCPSTLNIIIDQPATMSVIDSLNAQINTLVSVIDGGNTQSLLNNVNSNINSGQLRNILLAPGPYLSDTVLIAAIMKTNPVPPGILKEIIVPNSPVTTPVMKAINTVNLPAGIMQEIQTVQTGTSERAILEQQIAALQQQKDEATAELMRYYLNDTASMKIDSAIIFLESQPDLYSKKQLVQAYLMQENCTQANAILDSLPQQSEEDITFKNFYSIMAELCFQGKTVYDLTPEQEQAMYSIVATNTTTATAAKSVLTLVYGVYYPEIIEELYEQGKAGIKGNLYESSECGGAPVADTKIHLFDENGELVTSVSPAITDSTGFFWFNNYYLSLLDTTALYSINTTGGFKIDNPELKTIPEWFGSSPLTLNLGKVNMEWYDLYDSPDSIWTIGTRVDINGNVYVSGRTIRTLTNTDVVLIKYSPTGERIWTRLFDSGSAAYDNSDDMTLDSGGNIYLSISSVNTNTVLIKYNDTGQLLWQKTISGNNLKYDATQIEVTSTNNIVVAGEVSSTLTNNSDIFVALYDKNGNRKWLETFDNSIFDNISDMHLDNNDNIIITGSTTLQTTNCITIKFDNTGNFIWSRNITSDIYSTGSKITSDSNNNIYITGNITNNNLPAMFLVKYSSNGAQQWLNLRYSISPGEIIVGNDSSIYFTGTGLTDIVISKYNSNGNIIWTSTYNGVQNGYDAASAIALDNDDNVYLTGWNSIVPIPISSKSRDMATLKYSPSGDLLWVMTFNTPLLYSNDGTDIVVSVNNNVYVTGRSGTNNETYMSTIKYSQCPATAELRSGMASDIDNNESDSDIQVINFNENTITVYPNPYSDNTIIELIAKTESEVKLEVHTLTGQFVSNVYTGTLKSGIYKYDFSAKKLGYSAGTYILRAAINNEVSSYWLVEMR